jgi:hypothetical protein
MAGRSSTTRQKSCVPCARGKRKCDQGVPICSRCASKLLRCEYKSDIPWRVEDQRQGDENYDMWMSYPEGPAADIVEANLESSFPMLVNNELQPSLNGESSSHTGDFEDAFFGAYENLILTNHYPREVGVMDRDRIRFCVKQLKSYPEKLFREGKTPFIHPRAYDPVMPAPLQEACCASALYLGKTDANEALVWDIISGKATQLMEPHPSWSLSEQLVCVQALIIFQIIRLFDGDIRQRSDAERNDEILAQWTDSLAIRTGATAPSDSIIPAAWESWVFEEVVCRTIIVSRMVQAMFSIQKVGYCTLVAAVTELSFTVQKAFWDAPTAMHWHRAVKEKNRYHAPRMDFTETLSTATLDDVDELGLLMLVTYVGLDGANEWIVRTGSLALIE